MCVTSLLLLSSLGLAITVQAQNCSTPVGGSDMTLNELPPYPDGIRVTFACNAGYRGEGPVSITCDAGVWSPVLLRCRRSNCGAYDDVDRGYIDYTEGTEFGDKITLICDRGYRLVGRGQIFCGAHGWMGRLGECEVVTCTPPAVAPNVIVTPSRAVYAFGASVAFACPVGLVLDGPVTSSCGGTGQYTPAPPECVDVLCEAPVIPNAEWIAGSRPPFKYGSSVTYRCNPGFTMIGERSLTCGVGHLWLPKLPTCNDTVVISTRPNPSTTTTTPIRPVVTVRPTGGTGPDVTPGNAGHNKAVWLGVGLTVLIVSVLTACGCYFCGVPALIKAKRRKRNGPVGPTLLTVKKSQVEKKDVPGRVVECACSVKVHVEGALLPPKLDSENQSEIRKPMELKPEPDSSN